MIDFRMKSVVNNVSSGLCATALIAVNSRRCFFQRLFHGLVLALFVCATGMLHAAPNLQKVENIDGVTIIADHQDPRTFYYLKSTKALKIKEGAPDFHYYVNRYLGKKQTGDSDAFWVRGVLKLTTVSSFGNNGYQQLIDLLESRHGEPIRLEAAPVLRSYSELVYATIESVDGDGQEGVIEDLRSKDEELETPQNRVYGSTQQRFTIGLSGNDANLFWENFARDNLSLSLSYGWTVNGLILNSEDEWVASTYLVGNTLPLQVSSQQYPQLFTKNELWQQMQFAHSNLKVMCYDFINLDQSNLYYVNVEVRFSTLSGKRYNSEVKFKSGDEQYEQDVSFSLVNDIREGYQYRVRRMTNEGDITRTGWLNGNDSWLDVSLSGAELKDHETEGAGGDDMDLSTIEEQEDMSL